jgi:hypothetical protein
MAQVVSDKIPALNVEVRHRSTPLRKGIHTRFTAQLPSVVGTAKCRRYLMRAQAQGIIRAPTKTGVGDNESDLGTNIGIEMTDSGGMPDGKAGTVATRIGRK